MNTKRLLIICIILVSINILIMLTILIIIFNNKPTKTDRDFQEIKTANILNVVSTDFQEGDDNPDKFQLELCQFIAQRSGLTIQSGYEKDLKTAIRKLEKNVYDVIAQNILITNENREQLAFTVSTGQTKQVLVQRKNNDSDSVLFISNQLDLANKTIYLAKNSPAIMRIKHLTEEIAEPIHIKEISGLTSEQLFEKVAKNDIDYLATDLETALKNAESFPDLDFSIDVGFTQMQAWALRKNSPVLLDSLNVWITEFKEYRLGK